MSGLSALARDVADLARRAGAAIMAVYAGAFAVELKDDASPLTAADLAAHRILVAGLVALARPWPVLSEESADVPWSERRRWSRYWLVDPLDGTREFVKRNGEFTVNVALIEGHRPILGVVLAPVSGELALAWLGGGAWRETGPGATAQRLHSRALPQRPMVAGSRSHAAPAEQALQARLGPHDALALGSSLKFLRLAEGAADLYVRLGPTSEWDTAAAQCVLEEAGGAVLGLDGTALAYNTKASLLNPHFIAVGDPAQDWRRKLGLTAGALDA